jgi:DNA processing protein
VDYPREHRALFEQITGQGALISEYPPGAQPESWRFPLRNRVISGLSQGVLVVEAPRTSGALITARYAAEHGRPVMAVPGNIDRHSSVGCNDLIKDGALLVTDTADILHALGVIVGGRGTEAPYPRQITLDLEWQAQNADGASANAPAAESLAPRELPQAQARLLQALSLTPRHIDAVAEEVGMTATQAGVEMTLLELSGLARRLPGNNYIRALG